MPGNQISMIDGYEYDPPSPMEIAANNRRLIKPQDKYGLANNGKTCKTCANKLSWDYHDKRYHKCLKWKVSHSLATDIRVSWPACKLYQPEDV